MVFLLRMRSLLHLTKYSPVPPTASPPHPPAQIWKTWGLRIINRTASWVRSSSRRLHRPLSSHPFSPTFLICPPSLCLFQAFYHQKTLFSHFRLASVGTHHRIIAQGRHQVRSCYSHLLEIWVSWDWKGRFPTFV